MNRPFHHTLQAVQAAPAGLHLNHALSMALGRIAALFIFGAVLIFCLRMLLGQIRLERPALQVRPVPLMTQAERRVMAYIEDALPAARVHAQVSMGAIMQPARMLRHREATITRNRFSSKRVDFVVEDRASGRILALIELDDWSHSSGNDQWRDRLTASAGYRTIRLPAGERQTSATVRARLHAALFAASATS